ncbi:stage II sporulation protein R [[Clostridium] hylemonae]|nr:stage II sporulation protein R [[Clostridium] hylemonae]QEK16673.1 hypothetical protein LAJLEIBI_00674 [[Clostridium] hylemonae DSM 15053]BDF03306.1 stage II sporulation protein R [[Clostridium] hylemonae]
MREEIEKRYRKKQLICVILGVCIALILTGSIVNRRMKVVDAKVRRTQEKLAGEVFRFHVLANSDSEEDQALKLKVRDAVLAYMKSDMKDETTGEPSAEDTKQWAQRHLGDIEEKAGEIIREEGYSYGVKANVQVCHFPDKTYGDITFPEGDYEALRIEIGKAEGHNWWCVLYPNLCFMSTTCAVVSDEGKEELKEVLTDDEYEMVTATSDFKIKWFFFGGDAGKDQ